MGAELGIWGVVPAAGLGERMGAGIPKQYLQIGGASVIQHTLEALLGHPAVTGVVVALAPADNWWQSLMLNFDKPLITTTGGASRPESVLNALERLRLVAKPQDLVMVHDAARPCVREEDLDHLIEIASKGNGGGFLATRASDTLHRSDDHLHAVASVDRSTIWQAQTPQMFRFSTLLEALGAALERGEKVTDEVSAMLAAGHQPAIVEGHRDNLKITLPEDMILAEGFLKAQHRL